ncbi:transporter substrate-binding domain-containing protein [Balneatrix alpica]|uniref:Transporter substrate-binding domain-containing protein n=1 Tax=Balneatrix alpica TaxID=75684 RepID=A0ABV5Z6P8_9GAMM|nr:transporter substrate-binding domain-containing protein [Balneatrix alpica]
MKSLIFAAALALLAPFASAEKMTAVYGDWPPFFTTDPARPGAAMEIVRAAFASQGMELDIKVLNWSEVIEGTAQGEYDIHSGAWFMEERTMILSFSEPYLQNNIKFIKRKGNSFDYKGLNSLEGKKVGVIKDYGYGDEFNNDLTFTRVEADELMQHIHALVAGEIDLSLEDELVARSIIAEADASLLEQIEFTSGALSTQNLHVAVGNLHADKDKIISAFNAGLKAIKDNGTYEQILQNYDLR